MLCRNEVRIQYSEGISDTKLSDAWPGHWEGVLLSLLSPHAHSSLRVHISCYLSLSPAGSPMVTPH